MERPCITYGPLKVDALAREVASPSHGALVTFVGTVRDHHAGRTVTALHYSCYDAMAEKECRDIVKEAERSGRVRVALQHRIGEMQVGEAAVVVIAASAHRDDAFLACRMVIDAVKQRVPIWKHEVYADGTMAWVDPALPVAT